MKPAPFTHADYRDILHNGLAAGYRFVSFSDRGSAGKVCLLRHDCDNDLVASAAMARIETDEGVHSTYFLMLRSAMYNLLAPENMDLVRQIAAGGHWIGLHFDASALSDAVGHDVSREVDRQRNILAYETGQSVDVVSFHQPDQRILEGNIQLNCINTYSRSDMAGVAYTSDSNLEFRGGDPRDLFATSGHDKIQVLVHPEWWTPEPVSLEQKWAAMLSNNIHLMQKSLLQREKTYTKAHQVTIR